MAAASRAPPGAATFVGSTPYDIATFLRPRPLPRCPASAPPQHTVALRTPHDWQRRRHTATRSSAIMQPLARGQWNDHMFTAGESWGIPCTFRLQLFTANGHRPVALATQTADEGTSLTNAAERCAARVWELHTPEVAE